MKKNTRFVTFLSVLVFASGLYAQEKSARMIADEAMKKGSPEAAIKFIKEQAESVQAPQEKRALLSFLGSLQETRSLYSEACKSYAQAAGIAGGSVEGMPKKTNEQLVLDAVRCALSGGDGDTAGSYLNSSVRNSKNEEIQAKIKLYEQWAVLCNVKDSAHLAEPVAILKAYLSFDSMKSVKASILFTLWYLTGESQFSSLLNKEFPDSMENGIVNGKVMILPAPFWYFTPRTETVSEATSSMAEKVIQPVESEKSEKTEIPEEKKETEAAKTEVKNEKSEKTESVPAADEKTSSVKLQLGLFRDKANAETFVKSIKDKGFEPFIKEEKRASGNIYYAVLVDQGNDTDLPVKLKMAGFESYQYSE